MWREVILHLLNLKLSYLLTYNDLAEQQEEEMVMMRS